jgi:hypothetical protein
MGFEFDGGMGITETDLPKLDERVTDNGDTVLTSADGEFYFSTGYDTYESAMEAVKANLAFWLWAKQNPDKFKPKADPAVSNDILSVLEEAEDTTFEGLADALALAGFTRGNL